MAGTDHTKIAPQRRGPTIILVEPQLGENVGMAVRAMANFGLSSLRLVAPREGWAGEKARAVAAGAGGILDGAEVFPDARSAVADLGLVYATTARQRGQMKRVFAPDAAMLAALPRLDAGEDVGILFGRERTGLENDEIALADAIVTFPVNPAFASLNLAQAVLLVGYEWFKLASAGAVPLGDTLRSPPAPREMVVSLFEAVETELDAVDFYPGNKRPVMTRNFRDMILRMSPTRQDVKTLRGVVRALVEGRKSRKD
jgi:tRNA/rRNA methyltransferase